MEYKHKIEDLQGTEDGVVRVACGRHFDSWSDYQKAVEPEADIEPPEESPEPEVLPENPKPHKEGGKKK